MQRWDDMKARWGEVLDGFARRIAGEMQDKRADEPQGPPTTAFAHGFDAPAGLTDPTRVVECDAIARPNMHGDSIKAHEYHDAPNALATKVKALAALIRRSRSCCLYTGAGISTAAGIKDYASKAGGRSSVLPKSRSLEGTPFEPRQAADAEPTYAHRALVALYEHGLINGDWINQNHDGLPQKAKMPTHAVNDIHGSWWDPSNPVVPMDGRLRADLVRRLNETKRSADLVIAMGTSLSGVAADQVVSDIGHARRAARDTALPTSDLGSGSVDEPCGATADTVKSVAAPSSSTSGVLGAVIINVQQTRLDGCAALRIFATCDEVLAMLVRELSVDVPPAPRVAKLPRTHVWSGLPYDASSGERLPEGAACSMVDLSPGKRVKLADGNPPMAPIGMLGTVKSRTPHGHYEIAMDNGTFARLGAWIMEAAKNGELEKLPLVAAALE